MNLAAMIDGHPPNAVALISRGKATTYGELRDQVAGYRGGLQAMGLVPGDRVALLCGNNWYFVAAYLAVLGAGMVAVPLNPTSPSVAMARELAAVQPRAAVVGPTGRSAFDQVDRVLLPGLDHVIGCGFAGDRSVELSTVIAHEPAPVVPRDADDLAVLMFTSGTVGSPRAARLTHGNLLANLEQLDSHFEWSDGAASAPLGAPDSHPLPVGPTDRVLGVLPMSHIFGLNVVLGGALRAGASVVLVERFDPVSAVESIQRHSITIVSGPPTMWAAWAQLPGVAPDAFDSVRLAASGAAPLPSEVALTIHERYGLDLQEGYGLTETSPVVTSSAGVDAPHGSIGRPLPGVQMRLVDPMGADVLVGDAGEVLVRGPNVFAGYWEDPAATSTVLTPDGWLHTGDVAVVDDDGFLFLVDRAKDLIIVSGFNVFPAEVEEVVREHPQVLGCAVVGVPHPYSGEAVKAYVVVAPGSSVEEDELIDFCAERLPRYKCPEKVWFVDEIPQGLGGKLLRRALR